MNLEIKHLAPYLPYGLELECEHIYKGFTCKLVVGNHTTSFKNGMSIDTAIDLKAKPILRPLSQLTEEINHDKQFFTPIDTLDMNFLDFEYFHSNKGIDLSKVTYLDVVRLLSWHFDVFNLIENNLAIAVTDELNPYK